MNRGPTTKSVSPRLALAVVVAAATFAAPAQASDKVSLGGYAVASAYSAASTGSTRQGCPGAPPLRDSALSVATFLVGCGRRLQVCYRGRCVVVTRWDSGPFSSARQLDLNVGVVHALTGSWSAFGWGVRTVTWRAL